MSTPVTTLYGPALLMPGYITSGPMCLVYFTLADMKAGYLTCTMGGPGRYMILPKSEVYEIDQGEL